MLDSRLSVNIYINLNWINLLSVLLYAAGLAIISDGNKFDTLLFALISPHDKMELEVFSSIEQSLEICRLFGSNSVYRHQ